MEEDDYYLKWEKHHSAFVSVFDYLYKHDILVDCTLAAEEKYIKAHRIVLMACSSYLQKILCEHSENYPIVFFDIKYSELEAIVNFCYRGEVKIPFNQLEGFIEAATMLQIKGLCKSSDSDLVSDNSETNKRRLSFSDSSKSPCKKTRTVSNNNESDSGVTCDDVIAVEAEGGDAVRADRNGFPHPLAMVSVKPDPEDLLNLARDMQGSDNSDVDSDDTGGSSGPEGEDISHINDFLKSSSTLLFPWTCNRCGEAFATRAPYEEHRRNCVKVDPANHPWKCHKCPNAYKNKKDLVRHLIYCGNDMPRLYCNRCGNSYKYERGLRRHQKYCGTDVKPLKCPQCEKTYKYKRGLRRHQRRCGIAEALQFLAGKGVTPVVVTKRSFNVPGIGDLAKAGLPLITATSQLSQLTQLSTLDKTLKSAENSETKGQSLENSLLGNPLLPEASICPCGKVYKYKKSYDKHIATCACGSSQDQTAKNQQAENNDNSVNNVELLSECEGDNGEEAEDYGNKNEESNQEDSDEEDSDITDCGDQVMDERNDENKEIDEDMNENQEMEQEKHVNQEQHEEDGAKEHVDESKRDEQVQGLFKDTLENFVEEDQEVKSVKEGNQISNNKDQKEEKSEKRNEDNDEAEEELPMNAEG